MDSTISKLNKTPRYIYWIYIYSYKEVVDLPKDKILLFTLSFYTPFKNRALPSMILDKALDLSSDDDLDIVLAKYKLNHVKSVSEMVVSNNTNIIAIEVDDKKPVKSFVKHTTFYYFSAYRSPDYYTERKLLDEHPETYIPANTRLFLKIKVNIGRFLVTTNVIVKKLFTFLFKDYFDGLLESNRTKLEKELRMIKDRDYGSESETDSEVDLNDIDDDKLSYYSYCIKHNIKTIQ
jgi:hypothetical protein